MAKPAKQTAARLKTVYWPIGRLKPYAGNPKDHPPAQIDQIKSSIKEFGFNVPILVDANEVIVAGHGRILAAAELGIKELPVVQLGHLTPTQARAFRIADNKIPLNAEWNAELLARELGELRAEDFDVISTGFNNDEIAALLKSGDFLNDEMNAANGDAGLSAPTRGVALQFDVLPVDRDLVVMWLAHERDRRKLRTSAEALVALARDALGKSHERNTSRQRVRSSTRAHR